MYQYAKCVQTENNTSASENVFLINIRYLKDGDYCPRLNRVLPLNIRILAYSLIDDSFDLK
jgi:hypothetical protein